MKISRFLFCLSIFLFYYPSQGLLDFCESLPVNYKRPVHFVEKSMRVSSAPITTSGLAAK